MENVGKFKEINEIPQYWTELINYQEQTLKNLVQTSRNQVEEILKLEKERGNSI